MRDITPSLRAQRMKQHGTISRDCFVCALNDHFLKSIKFIMIFLLFILIPSAFAQNVVEDIRDIKGLEHFSYSWVYYAIPVFLALVILAFIVWRIIQKINAKKQKIVIVKSPYEIALEELEGLRQSDLFSRKGERVFHFQMSEIFRRYLEGIYNFRATDMTTEEIAKALPNNSQVNDILIKGDLVKFADIILGKNISYELLDRIFNFVHETAPENEEAVDAGGKK